MVTLPPLAGIVKMLMPEQNVQCLLAAGKDPHHAQLTPKQVEALKDARILIRSSADDANWNLRSEPQQAVFDMWPHQQHGWLTPAILEQRLPALANILAQTFPSQAEALEQQLRLALQDIHAEDQRWQQALAPIREHGAMMQHNAWKSLLDAYNVPVHAILETEGHHHEQGPHALEHALETFEQHPHSWLIGTMRHSNRSLEWLKQKASSQSHLIYLDALGSCQQSWLELSQANRARINQ